MRERVILHSDLNNFFASVEIVLHPDYKGKPLVVCGDKEKRLGVVLAKNYEAKAFGIQTGEPVVMAERKCPRIIKCEPHFKEYVKYSGLVKDIYAEYTDRIEECSIDECALDMTESTLLFGSGEEIAERIRCEVKEKTGLTVSIGVSFNKVFAKLASELKKPDAVSVISRENYKKVVFPLPCEDLLYVGKNTADILRKNGIHTIGEIASADVSFLTKILGKRGCVLSNYARGEDDSPVLSEGEEEKTKSVGNSMTLPKDIWDREEIRKHIYTLSENIAMRIRKLDIGKCDTIHVWAKNENLKETIKQKRISPTELAEDIAKAAYELFCSQFPIGFKVHALGISTSGFDYHIEQISFGEEKKLYDKKKRAEDAVAKIRDKYGYEKLRRGIVMDDELTASDIKSKKE